MAGLDEKRVAEILRALPDCRVAVVGDFCLDRYFHVDPAVADCSKETGLPIHQVVEVRTELGGAANVLHNLAALGVGQVIPVGLIGDDGDGFELVCILESLGVKRDFLRATETRRTPVYLKPLIVRPGDAPREISRFDVFPREPLAEAEEAALIADMRAAFETADALIIADYGEAGKAGIVTPRLREAAAELARMNRDKPVLADSRLNIDKFRHIIIKPNAAEAVTYLAAKGPEAMCPSDRADGHSVEAAPAETEPNVARLTEIGQRAAERNQRPVLITLGAAGILLCASGRAEKIPVFPSERYGAIDIVGAGDATLAAVTAALAGGAALDEAAMLGMAVASITIQEIGRCGTASPEQVRKRFREYAELFPDVVGA